VKLDFVQDLESVDLVSGAVWSVVVMAVNPLPVPGTVQYEFISQD
jgi:hypothetical protein